MADHHTWEQKTGAAVWRRCSAVLLLALATPVAAQVYKWVDSKGTTHYSEKAPAGEKSKPVELRDTAPRPPGTPDSGAAAASASSDFKGKEIEFRRRQAAREEAAALAEQDKARRDAACKSARARLINLQRIGSLYRLDDKGERVFMSNAERDATVAKYEADVNRNCP